MWKQMGKSPEVGKLETELGRSQYGGTMPGMQERRGLAARPQLAGWEEYLGSEIREALYLQAGYD